MRAQKSTLRGDAELKEKWYILDAEGQVVGRFASRVAKLVRGKLQPDYTPHQDPKIHVIITNAEKIVFTADKMKTKQYFHHSGWRTGIKVTTPEKLIKDDKPERILEKAIHGMLPKGALGRQLNRHVRIFKSGDYTGQHDAQTPEKLEVSTRTAKEN